jgi:hypothetical protein
MWEHVVWVIGTVAAGAGAGSAIALSIFVLWGGYHHSGDDGELERALAGEVFLAEAITSDGSVEFCGCLQGIPVGYVVTCGASDGGVVCLNCARAEFLSWCLRQRCGIGDGEYAPVANGEK